MAIRGDILQSPGFASKLGRQVCQGACLKSCVSWTDLSIGCLPKSKFVWMGAVVEIRKGLLVRPWPGVLLIILRQCVSGACTKVTP